MDIRARIQEVTNRFDNAQAMIKERSEIIEKAQREISEIAAEQKSMQGEYKILQEFAIEQGVMDTEGNFIEKSTEAPTIVAEVVKDGDSSTN